METFADNSNKLKYKFIQGLWEQYYLTPEDLINDNYKYCGGDGGTEHKTTRHYNYWVMKYGNTPFPLSKKQRCICKHPIDENCFITNGTKFVHMGNCCIKRFMPENSSGRTCELCDEPHKNRKYNLCNDCKTTHKKCETCQKYFKFKSPRYTSCYKCHVKKCEEDDEEDEDNKNNKNDDEKNDEDDDEKEKETNNEEKIKQTREYKKMQSKGLMCYCNLPTKMYTSKKENANKGKQFYTCPKYFDLKCKYFMWKSVADENANLQI